MGATLRINALLLRMGPLPVVHYADRRLGPAYHRPALGRPANAHPVSVGFRGRQALQPRQRNGLQHLLADPQHPQRRLARVVE